MLAYSSVPEAFRVLHLLPVPLPLLQLGVSHRIQHNTYPQPGTNAFLPFTCSSPLFMRCSSCGEQ